MPSPQAKKHIWPNYAHLHGPGDPHASPCPLSDYAGCLYYLKGIGKTGKSLPIAEANDLIARGLAVDHPPQGS